MERSVKNKYYTGAIIYFLYIFFVALPYENWLVDVTISYAVRSALLIPFLLISVWLLIRDNFDCPKLLPAKSSLVLLPLIIVTFSNYLSVFAVGGGVIRIAGSSDKLLATGIYSFLVAIAEEMLFRFVIIENLKTKIKNRFLLMLISAAIFGLTHLLNLFSGGTQALVQVAYTFALGLFLGAIYTCKGGMVFIVLFHFLFNFVNGVLFETTIFSSFNPFSLIIANVYIGVVLILYGLAVLIIKQKKNAA